MALTFTDLQTFFFARGFDFMSDGGAGLTRAKRFINDGMHLIDDLDAWPYLQTSTTGSAPLTISDLGEVESVWDGANQNMLGATTRQQLSLEQADLTLTGTAQQFYLVGGAITTYPVSTATLTVSYRKVSPDLSAGSDAPLMPDRFRMAIVDYAAMLAFRESNVPDEAQAAQVAGDSVVARMREFFVLQPGSQRQTITGVGSYDW